MDKNARKRPRKPSLLPRDRCRDQHGRHSSRRSSGSSSGFVAGALALAFTVLARPRASGPWPLYPAAVAATRLDTEPPVSASGNGEGGGAALAAPPGAAVGGETGGTATGGGGGGTSERVPKVPFCRAGADVANMWMPVWDSDSQTMVTAKRVVVFGGKGVDYYNRRAGDELSYLSDMWALHITNTGFKWSKIAPQGQVQPSPRWQTGDSVAYGSSLVVYGGDDQTTNQVGGLGDLWVYSPRGTRPRLHADDYYDNSAKNDWTQYTRGGKHPGERREPSLTMINSTLLLQGGRVDDGESNERCDSRFFLVDLADPDGVWREGPDFPGECGLGQTMDTVNVTRGHEDDGGGGGGGGSAGQSQVRAVVFGGCKWDSDGMFVCSNDLYAYSLEENKWEEIIPKSDADSYACAADDTEEGQGSPSLRPAHGSDVTSTPTSFPASSSSSSSSASYGSSSNGSNNEIGGGEAAKKTKPVVCPGESTSRPLGRHAHASAYIESKADNVHALFIFGGRENMDDLTPLGDLWMFDFRTMRWSEITPGSKAPPNRFFHSLTVWQGGAGDGVASLVVFGGETITRTGQTAYMNDVWLYTPHTGAWREVSRSDCKEGASGIVGGANWAPIVALVSLLVLVVVVQCFLHYICPTYHPPARRRRRRRRKTEDGTTSGSAVRGGGANGIGAEEEGVKRGESAPSLATQGLLASSPSNPDKPSYSTLAE
eukprot:g5009.t1